MNRPLEERAIAARESIGDAASRVTPPTFEPSAQRPPMIVVAALIFAVIGLGGWLMFGGDGGVSIDAAGTEEPGEENVVEEEPIDEEPTTTTTVATLDAAPMARVHCPTSDESAIAVEPETAVDDASAGSAEVGGYLVFDPPPPEYKASILELPTPEEDMAIPLFSVFGCPGNDPFAAGDLLVATAGPGLTLEDIAGGQDAQSVEVAGRTVWIATDEDFPVISWFEDEDAGVVMGLLSQAFNQATLLSIAASWLTGDEDGWGLELLGTDLEPDFGFQVVASTVTYEKVVQPSGSGGTESSIIRVGPHRPGSENGELLTTWFMLADDQDETSGGVGENSTEIVDYNGLEVTIETRFDSSVALTFERDGQRILIQGFDPEWGEPTPESLLELIDTVRPATDAEVEALRLDP